MLFSHMYFLSFGKSVHRISGSHSESSSKGENLRKKTLFWAIKDQDTPKFATYMVSPHVAGENEKIVRVLI